MNEGIIHFGYVFHRSVLEQDIDAFVGRIIGRVHGFAGKYKIACFLHADPELRGYLFL